MGKYAQNTARVMFSTTKEVKQYLEKWAKEEHRTVSKQVEYLLQKLIAEKIENESKTDDKAA